MKCAAAGLKINGSFTDSATGFKLGCGTLPVGRELSRCLHQNTSAAISARPTTPPTVPPTIDPVLDVRDVELADGDVVDADPVDVLVPE